jgi:signal transduction histidine kinase
LRLENLEATGDEVVAGNLAAAGREVARQSRIVDGLLVLGRAERSQPDRRPVDLPPAIAERCDAWAALAAERRVTLARDGTDHLAPAVLVPGDLEQILDNLLANALDASTAGSTITVTLRGGAGRAEIHVVDEGPGLSDEDRSRAFDRFWQGQAHSGGTSGLGLAIVRQLARRNDLDVRLDAAAGGGVDAVVSVPLPSVGRPVLEPGTALVRHRPSPE